MQKFGELQLYKLNSRISVPKKPLKKLGLISQKVMLYEFINKLSFRPREFQIPERGFRERES